MRATDCESFFDIIRHGLVPSSILRQVVTSAFLAHVIDENSLPNLTTVQFAALNPKEPNSANLRSNKTVLLILEANTLARNFTRFWYSPSSDQYQTPQAVESKFICHMCHHST